MFVASADLQWQQVLSLDLVRETGAIQVVTGLNVGKKCDSTGHCGLSIRDYWDLSVRSPRQNPNSQTSVSDDIDEWDYNDSLSA